MNYLAGIDIGGTKCAVSIALEKDGELEILDKKRFPTPETPEETIMGLLDSLDGLLGQHNLKIPDAIGISCGGPLDSKKGLILSPPNLPDWDQIDIISPFSQKYGIPVGLENDANAGALAEWQFGAGRGVDNLIFLTFGTGMGAGLILNGALYRGTNDLAGEVGHIRLAEDGPVGYGKAGSFEGFCSGGGIARLAQKMTKMAIKKGTPPLFCKDKEELDTITARTVGEAAQQGDKLALEIYRVVGEKLGQGLAILVDILNPQKIIIGSIYGRQQEILQPAMERVLKEEALNPSRQVCKVLPAGLGERIGDYASLSVAFNTLREGKR